MTLIRTIILLLLLCATGAANDLIRAAEQIRIPLPETWLAAGDTIGFPVNLVNEDLTAEFQIFKNELAKEDAITNREQLRATVDGIIEEVIMEMPNAEILTNTGYQDGNSVWFVLEFTSEDMEAGAQINHRLAGVLYRLTDDSQLLFTLWGKAGPEAPSYTSYDFRTMQTGFEYMGETAATPFTDSSSSYWYLFSVAAIILLLLAWIRRGKEKHNPA